MMKKAPREGTDQYKVLLELQNTPCQDFDLSPVKMMIGQKNKIAHTIIENRQTWPQEVQLQKELSTK